MKLFYLLAFVLAAGLGQGQACDHCGHKANPQEEMLNANIRAFIECPADSQQKEELLLGLMSENDKTIYSTFSMQKRQSFMEFLTKILWDSQKENTELKEARQSLKQAVTKVDEIRLSNETLYEKARELGRTPALFSSVGLALLVTPAVIMFFEIPAEKRNYFLGGVLGLGAVSWLVTMWSLMTEPHNYMRSHREQTTKTSELYWDIRKAVRKNESAMPKTSLITELALGMPRLLAFFVALPEDQLNKVKEALTK